MHYLAAGQTSLDKTTFPGGKVEGPYLGGTALFGYGGIRLWDDDCAPVANTGADFDRYFGDWMRENHIAPQYLKTVYDHTHMTNLTYQEDGSYENQKTPQEKLHSAFLYGMSNCTIEQLEHAAADSKGLYLYLEPIELTFWKNLAQMKARHSFALMWEPGFSTCEERFCTRVLAIYEILRPEMSSLYHFEACTLFGTDDLEEIFVKIEALHIPFFFYRAGRKGAWALSGGHRFFVPSIDIEPSPAVDPTGCGNTTTAAAMYGWLRTKNPVMAAIMANISGGFNVRQRGMIPQFTQAMRRQAEMLAIENYHTYYQNDPACRAAGLAENGQQVLGL